MPEARLKNLLELNFKKGEKVKVSPIGDVIGLDGRAYKIDGEELLKDIQKNGLHIVLDENHSFGEALGWFDFNSFELREDGIYADLEPTPKGDGFLGTKSYRYLSPVYNMSWNDRRVLGLDSVGLVNRPNLLNNELNKKEEEILNELEQLKADNAKLLEQNTALTAEIAKLKGTTEQNTAAKGADDVENSPAYKALKEQNDKVLSEFAEMKTLLAKFGEQKNLEENNNDLKVLSEDEKKVAKLLGLTEENYRTGKGA